MNCPNCGKLLRESNWDCRQEWRRIYYEPCECGKIYERLTTYKTQSQLVETDELAESK